MIEKKVHGHVNGENDILTKVTKNGEICFRKSTGLYEVFDETYSTVICTTCYFSIAELALEEYCRSFLK